MAKNLKFQQGHKQTLNLTVASGTVSGNPIVDGQIPAAALTDRRTDGKATCQLNGVFDFTVNGVDQAGNSAVAEGDRIYHTQADAIKLSKKNTGVPYGFAASAGPASGASGPCLVRIEAF